MDHKGDKGRQRLHFVWLWHVLVLRMSQGCEMQCDGYQKHWIKYEEAIWDADHAEAAPVGLEPWSK